MGGRRLQRSRSHAGGIEPPAREAGWKAGAPSPGRLAGFRFVYVRLLSISMRAPGTRGTNLDSR